VARHPEACDQIAVWGTAERTSNRSIDSTAMAFMIVAVLLT